MTNNFSIPELTIKDIIRSLFNHKLIIINTIIIVTAGAAIMLKMKTPEYEASVKMLIRGVNQTESLIYGNLSASRIHNTQMEIVKSEPVIKRVVTTLKLDERPADYEKKYSSLIKKPIISFFAQKKVNQLNKLDENKRKDVLIHNAIDRLKNNITIKLLPNTDIFYIYVKDFNPDTAQEIANVLSRSYTIFDQQQQLAELALKYGNLHPTVQQLQDNILLMDKNLSGAKLPDFEAFGTASVKIIEQATTDATPIGTSKSIQLFVAFLFSFFIGCALAFMIDMIDQTFKTPNDILAHLHIPALGSIPKISSNENPLIRDLNEATKYSIFYEDLADQIYIFMKTQNIKTILMTSIQSKENHLSIVPNLGYIFSQQMHHKTLLIDCNVKNPSFQHYFNISNDRGISNKLDDTNIEDLLLPVDSDFDVIAVGNSAINSLTFINKLQINSMIKDIRNIYEIILIDCTNTKNFNDITKISKYVDGIIVIINENREKKYTAKRALSSLDVNMTKIVGGILNDRTFKIPEKIYKRL